MNIRIERDAQKEVDNAVFRAYSVLLEQPRVEFTVTIETGVESHVGIRGMDDLNVSSDLRSFYTL